MTVFRSYFFLILINLDLFIIRVLLCRFIFVINLFLTFLICLGLHQTLLVGQIWQKILLGHIGGFLGIMLVYLAITHLSLFACFNNYIIPFDRRILYKTVIQLRAPICFLAPTPLFLSPLGRGFALGRSFILATTLSSFLQAQNGLLLALTLASSLLFLHLHGYLF